MKYLMIIDDQTVLQRDEISEGDDQSVQEGYLDVIRFEGGQFERWQPGKEPEWIPV